MKKYNTTQHSYCPARGGKNGRFLNKLFWKRDVTEVTSARRLVPAAASYSCSSSLQTLTSQHKEEEK